MDSGVEVVGHERPGRVGGAAHLTEATSVRVVEDSTHEASPPLRVVAASIRASIIGYRWIAQRDR
jgi:hypothetical protein